MLRELFPKAFNRYLSLPLLGPILDDFDNWLLEQGYQFRTRREHIKQTVGIDNYFQKQRRSSLSELNSRRSAYMLDMVSRA